MAKLVITRSSRWHEGNYVFWVVIRHKSVELTSEECGRTTGAADEEEEDVINTQNRRKTRNSLKHKHREIVPFI